MHLPTLAVCITRLLKLQEREGCQDRLNASSLPLCYSDEGSAHSVFVFFFFSPLVLKLMTVLHEESFLFLIEDWLSMFCDNFRNILGWFLLFASYKYCALSADD